MTFCGAECQELYYTDIGVGVHSDVTALFNKLSHMKEYDIFHVVERIMTDRRISADQKYKEVAMLYDKKNLKLVKKLPVQDYSQLHSMRTLGLRYALRTKDERLLGIIVRQGTAMNTQDIAGVFIETGRNDLLAHLLSQRWARKTMGNWKTNQVIRSYKAPTQEKQREAEALLAKFKKTK
jgi:hypothetical protein